MRHPDSRPVCLTMISYLYAIDTMHVVNVVLQINIDNK